MGPNFPARATFECLATLAAANLEPAGRAEAIASTLRQIGVHVASATCSPFDLWHTFLILSFPRRGDDHPTASRRTTCRDLARLLWVDTQCDYLPGPATSAAIAIWEAMTRFGHDNDPRHLAIRATATRELAELHERAKKEP